MTTTQPKKQNGPKSQRDKSDKSGENQTDVFPDNKGSQPDTSEKGGNDNNNEDNDTVLSKINGPSSNS